jgi:MFS family permease
MGSAATTDSLLSTRQGKLILALVCLAGFLDVIDTTIVNVALPSIREHIHFSVQSLQWIASGYLLTYGGFMLLGGRAADLLGRRRLLVAGTLLFGISSLVCGLAASEAVLIGARLAQGVGAAMMTPAALSILTTSFPEGKGRTKAIGLWSATIPLAAVIGVLASGLLTQGPGWRWVFFVNLPVCAVVLAGAVRLLDNDKRRAPVQGLRRSRCHPLHRRHAAARLRARAGATDRLGQRSHGWRARRRGRGAPRLRRRRTAAPQPLFPLSIFQIKGLAAADATQVIAQAGFYSMFFFVTLYMQNVLGFSPIEAGAAYVPVTIGVGMATGVATKMLPRTGARPIIIVGALVGAVGVYYLSRIPVHGSYLANVLPGLVVMVHSASARSSSACRRPRMPACLTTRRDSLPLSVAPPLSSVVRLVWPSSRRSPPARLSICWPLMSPATQR